MAFNHSTVLDDVGRRILAEVQADGRVSLAELGRRVALSPPAVAERLRRLEDAGVISGYTARVDPQAVGYGLMAFVRLSPTSPQGVYAPKVTDLVQNHPEILECHHLTGDDCFLIKVVARDAKHLEGLIGAFAALGRTTTSLVLSSPVPGAPVTPPC